MKAQSFCLTVSMVMVIVWFTWQLYLQTNTGKDDVEIGLVENTTLYSGIIDLKIRNESRSVCHDQWTDEDAQVACRSMGLPFTGKLCNLVLNICKGTSSPTFSRDRVIHKSSVIKCRVSFCIHKCLSIWSSCTSINDLEFLYWERRVNSCQFVTCSTTFLASDNYFTANTATTNADNICTFCFVFTRQLHIYGNEKGLLHSAPFAGAEKEINGRFEPDEEVTYWLSQVSCRGDEESLLACRHSGVGNHDCGKDERAKVICKGKDIINPRRACTTMVTVLGLCVCVSVHVFCH